MLKKLALSRPATSAIAAFLVLTTPSAVAQEAPAPVAPPATVPTVTVPAEPAPTAPTAPMAAPVQPAPVIRVPVAIEPAPAAETAPRSAPEPAARPAPVARTAPAARMQTPVATAAPAPADVAPPEAAPVGAAESIMRDEALPPVAPVSAPDTAAPAETVAGTDGFPWEIAGGAAALLIAGGLGLAFARRRRSHEWNEPAARYETVPSEPVAPHPVAPVTATPPVMAQPFVAPREARSVEPAFAPERRSTPAFAAAPSGSMGRHEAMALVGPTADNPFLTLKKRLKRARFYDRRERMEYDGLLDQPQVARQPVSAWEIANRPEPAAAAAKQAARRPDKAPLFPGRLRPGYAGN